VFGSGKTTNEVNHKVRISRYKEEWWDDFVEYEVIHPDSCKEELLYAHPEGQDVYGYTCGVQYVVEHVGLDDIEGWQELEDGEYDLGFYAYTPSSWYEDDAECYCYIPPEQLDKSKSS
jgi:hypothetical protein